MIKSLTKAEIHKLIHSKQMKVLLCLIIAYVGVLPFIMASPGSYSVFEKYRNVTSDIAVMTIFISLISSVVFASEYTQKTMKNLIQNNSRCEIFFVKMSLTIICVALLLIVWYLIGILVVMVQTHSLPDSIIMINYTKRYSIQILFILLQTFALITLSIVVKKQAVVNISSFICFFIISFTPYYQWIVTNYFWGNWGLPLIYISLILICVIITVFNYLIFLRQEIK